MTGKCRSARPRAVARMLLAVLTAATAARWPETAAALAAGEAVWVLTGRSSPPRTDPDDLSAEVDTLRYGTRVTPESTGTKRRSLP